MDPQLQSNDAVETIKVAISGEIYWHAKEQPVEPFDPERQEGDEPRPTFSPKE